MMKETPVQCSIRVAGLGDADLLARLGAKTFADTFAADNTAEDMAAYLASAFGPEVQAAELRSPDTLFLIAEAAGEAVGYAQLQAAAAPACVAASRPIELVRFYVDAAWQGRSISHRLMEEVLARARDGGHDVIWLGVWERNARALSFYRKWAFEVIGDKSFRLGSDVQTDYVMSRPLS